MNTPEFATYIAKPGLYIQDPVTRKVLPHEGEGLRVERTKFWVRRELADDVIRTDTQKSAPAKRMKSEG